MQSRDRNEPDFPKAIVAAIDALADKHRRQILIHLKENGPLAYSELVTQTSLEKGTLNHHLEKLMAGALIRNFKGASPVNQYSSFYELSSIAIKLVDNVFNSFAFDDPSMDTIDSASEFASSLIVDDPNDESASTLRQVASAV